MAVLFGLKYHTPNFKYLPYKNTLTNFTQICLYSSTVLSTLVSDRCFQTRQLYHLLKHSHWMCDALIDAACFDVRKPWSLSHSCRFHFSRCHGESPDRIWWQTASMNVEGSHRQLIHSIWLQVIHYSAVICCWNLVKNDKRITRPIMYSAVSSWMNQYAGHGTYLLSTKCVFDIYQTLQSSLFNMHTLLSHNYHIWRS